jgi:hypothetical protein
MAPSLNFHFLVASEDGHFDVTWFWPPCFFFSVCQVRHGPIFRLGQIMNVHVQWLSDVTDDIRAWCILPQLPSKAPSSGAAAMGNLVPGTAPAQAAAHLWWRTCGGKKQEPYQPGWLGPWVHGMPTQAEAGGTQCCVHLCGPVMLLLHPRCHTWPLNPQLALQVLGWPPWPLADLPAFQVSDAPRVPSHPQAQMLLCLEEENRLTEPVSPPLRWTASMQDWKRKFSLKEHTFCLNVICTVS